MVTRRSIEEILEDARARLDRLTPAQALRAQQEGAVIVDTRADAERTEEGEIPGAVVIPRSVLEWRLDPACEHRLPIASYDLRVVVVCSDGYSSSLAAASLQDLGLTGTTDLIGGYRGWKDAGLPTF